MNRSDEARQTQLRLRQCAERTDKLGIPVTGRFLTAEEQSLARQEARRCGVEVSFSGGWQEAERVQPCFHPAWEEPVFTLQWLEIRWNGKFARVDHRDLLGSLMALGMDRSFLGDLIALEDHAYLCALPEMALRLPMEWEKAGNAVIRVTVLDEPPALEPPKGVMLRDTVASLRLDSVLAAGMKISRARASELIRQGVVSVDHQLEERTDRMMTVGQILSIRGFGRVRLREVGQPTRKDRLPIALEIFAKT
ncbi:MAG: YlmH/Sll1252 family protein [Aristaeellaceae bacterium]